MVAEGKLPAPHISLLQPRACDTFRGVSSCRRVETAQAFQILYKVGLMSNQLSWKEQPDRDFAGFPSRRLGRSESRKFAEVFSKSAI
jgi:hypothetical protein